MKNYFFKVVRYALMLPLNVLFCFSCLLPKNKTVWLFGAWFGEKFLDNPKYVFKELLQQEKKINAYWITKSRSLLAELKAKGYPVAYAYSLQGIYLQLRAGVVVFSHSVPSEFMSGSIGLFTKRIQLWHGIPIKKIGYDDKNSGVNSLKERVIRKIYPFLTDYCHLVIAASEADQKIYSSAFNVPLERVKVAGYPRNDEIVRRSSSALHKSGDNLLVMYMPTLRGAPDTEFKLLSHAGFDYDAADKLLESLNMELHIKLHPVQVFTEQDLIAINNAKRITAVFNDDDIYESIGNYDILITDYSGIYFDFLITGKPIIMAPIDFNDYTRLDRELYYEYPDICPAAPCHSWQEIFETLATGCKTVPDSYRSMQSRFHKYLDAGSSRRVIQAVSAL